MSRPRELLQTSRSKTFIAKVEFSVLNCFSNGGFKATSLSDICNDTEPFHEREAIRNTSVAS